LPVNWLGKGIIALKISSSTSCGKTPEYSFVKVKRFFTPDPSSPAHPISLNTRAITGFLGKGVKPVGSIRP
jgi:hypothetical protein